VLTDLEQLTDVRMADRRGRPGLAEEPLPNLAVLRLQNGLDRNRAPETIVARLIDDPHAAAPDLPDDAVGTDDLGVPRVVLHSVVPSGGALYGSRRTSVSVS